MLLCAQILNLQVRFAGTDENPLEALARIRAGGRPRPCAGASSSKGPSALSPQQRRRLSPLGRLAADALWALPEEARSGAAWVFASRWGDIESAMPEIERAARGEDVSPTKFAVSVHNGIAAQLSIASSHRAPSTAIAGGPFSLEAGFEAAVGLLSEHERAALIVYDAKPPAAFGADGLAWAAALLLGPQLESSNPAEFERLQALGPVAALRTRPLRPGEAVDAAVDAPGGFPPALETLAWLLWDDALTLEHVGRHASHVWAKTARFAPHGAPSGTAR